MRVNIGSMKTRFFVLCALAALSLLGSPGEALGGPNIVAIGNYEAVPLKRAEGRVSFSGKEVIFSFDDPQFDFGRVVVRSTQPTSVVRRDFNVGYTGTDLRVGGSVAGATAVSVSEVEIWLKLKGQLRPGATYEWEIEPARLREGDFQPVPAVIPAFWADGQPIGVDVTISDEPEETDKIQRLKLPHGSVKVPLFEKQTGAAWIILKIRNLREGFGLARFSFREADEAVASETPTTMPVPVRYIPIRNQVEDLISEVTERSTMALERLQAPDGSWGTGNLNEKVMLTSVIAVGLGELNSKNERVINAMKWLEAQNPPENESFGTEAVGRRMILLSRFGTMSAYGPIIQRDAQFLVDAQLEDGGWGDRSPKDQRNGEIVLSQHFNSSHTLYALREARMAGAEVDARVFRNAMKYWTEAQSGDGGFTLRLSKYGTISPPSVANTAIGVTGMVTALDMAAGFGSKRCSAFLSSKDQLRTIDKGVQWLNEQYDDEYRNFGPFTQNANPFHEPLWLVLFGELTGIDRISGKNYFAEEADQLLKNYDPATGLFGVRGGQGRGLGGQGGFSEAPSPGRTALALWTLGTGNAPTVVQRIIAGDEEGAWTENRSDVAHLVRYLARSKGVHYNWRRADIGRDLAELAEVPLLLLSVVGPMNWSDQQWGKIREYCLAGGTVIVDIGDEAEGQRAAVTTAISKSFPEYPLSDLKNDAGVFAVNSSHKPVARIKALGNGFRDFLFLPPKSWSCAWQTYDTKQSEDSFLFMEDLLHYETDGTPPRSSFARSTYAVPSASSRVMTAAMVQVGSEVPAYPNLIDTMSRLMQANYRTRVDEVKAAEADVAWVLVTGPAPPSDAAKQQLGDALKKGKHFFVDVVSGQPDWDESFRAALKALEPGISFQKLRRNDPIYTGEIAGTQGFDVTTVPFRKALHDRFAQAGRCDLYGIYLNGRMIGIHSAHDISSGVTYHYFPGCRGVMPDAARQIAINMFLSVYGAKLNPESRVDAN